MKSFFLTLVAVGALAGASKAELVLDNIGNTSSDSFIGSYIWRAQSFETSAGSWTLDDVVLRLSGFTSNFFVAIYADSGSNLPAAAPGGVLETLTGQSSFSSPAYSNITYTSSGLSLSGNTRYWLVAGDTLGGEMFWSTAPDSTTSTAIWSIPGTNPSADGSDGGGSWSSTSTILNFSINATAAAPAAVPEPGTWAAAALLAGGAAFARWRRRRDSK